MELIRGSWKNLKDFCIWSFRRYILELIVISIKIVNSPKIAENL
ncbi:MAG: hypothetical protein JWR21_1939 [Herminiimonas sp.]|nr:hypothetical protein [Herminiimonas sp.]